MLCNVERCKAKRKKRMKIDSHRERRDERWVFLGTPALLGRTSDETANQWPWHRDSGGWR